MSALRITHDEFVGALKLLKKTVRPKRGEEAILSFDGKLFYIDVGGGSVTMPSTGEWPDQVRVPAIPLLGLARFPPRDDPVVINQEDGRVQIGTTVLRCTGGTRGDRETVFIHTFSVPITVSILSFSRYTPRS